MADAEPPDGTNPTGLTRRTVIAGAVALAGGGTLLRPASGRSAPPDVAAHARAGHGAGSRGMDITAALGRDREGRFGLMFKALEPFSPPDELLHDLASRMAEPALSGAASDQLDNPEIPSGYTYLGQFVVHDVTFDRTPLPLQAADPLGITNFDTPRLDLGVIYGTGPGGDPDFYEPDGSGRLRVERPNGIADLPRRPDGTALIGDPRNDENLILAQLHVAFLRFHNRLVEAGRSFAEAQRLTRWHYQWVVVHDLLARVAGRSIVERFLRDDGKGPTKVKREHYKPKNPHRAMMPLEFSLAAFRFGHSMVRPLYRVNAGASAPVFADPPTDEDLHGGRPIPARFEITWDRFFPTGATDGAVNLARRIDTRLSPALSHLPVPFLVPPQPQPVVVSLAARNLLRGKRLGLPAGDAVSHAMGVAPLSNEAIGLPGSGWQGHAPLWFYLLAEAQHRRSGLGLGEVGGRIVAEVLLTLLEIDKTSFLDAKPRFEPGPPMVPAPGHFEMADFLAFAQGA